MIKMVSIKLNLNNEMDRLVWEYLQTVTNKQATIKKCVIKFIVEGDPGENE